MNKLTLQNNELIPLRDVVYKTIRDAILKGELKPGTRLMEIHLASSLGVSRTPVREAIRMLEREGLAVTFPRRGAQVAHMSVKDLEDVIEIRESLDVLAATKTCENVTDEVIERLESSVEAFRNVIKSGDFRKIVEADEDFHNIIYEAANNPKLTQIVKSLREQMYRYRYEYIKEKDMISHLLTEHENILLAIKRRDKSYVIEMMREHIDNQYKTVKRLIEKREEEN